MGFSAKQIKWVIGGAKRSAGKVMNVARGSKPAAREGKAMFDELRSLDRKQGAMRAGFLAEYSGRSARADKTSRWATRAKRGARVKATTQAERRKAGTIGGVVVGSAYGGGMAALKLPTNQRDSPKDRQNRRMRIAALAAYGGIVGGTLGRLAARLPRI